MPPVCAQRAQSQAGEVVWTMWESDTLPVWNNDSVQLLENTLWFLRKFHRRRKK